MGNKAQFLILFNFLFFKNRRFPALAFCETATKVLVLMMVSKTGDAKNNHLVTSLLLSSSFWSDYLSSMGTGATRGLPKWLFTTVRVSLGLTYDVSFELSQFDRLKLRWYVVSVTSTPGKVTI
ncbi:uncharacterized protein LOC131251155 isoform X1 [Magnolia sinica]|uniref:uncharacterized protein LOC131251155 isoform X1 n=1 Tax=Magnolia sinica TaxID=86752 RepID=UPI002658D701|nr:uncharacterized protein LOC131251155 isoform X1 [Magnolia sinica]